MLTVFFVKYLKYKLYLFMCLNLKFLKLQTNNIKAKFYEIIFEYMGDFFIRILKTEMD